MTELREQIESAWNNRELLKEANTQNAYVKLFLC